MENLSATIHFMDTLLAVDNPERGAAFVDYIGLFGALATILVGVMTAAVALRNNRKGRIEQLDTLVKICNDWPPHLRGREAVEQEIVLQVARLQMSGSGAWQGRYATPEERAAAEWAWRADRPNRIALLSLPPIYFLLAAGVTWYQVGIAHHPFDWLPGLVFSAVVTTTAWVCVAIVIYRT